MSPRQIFEQQFRMAAAEGAIYELRMRLLADRVPELQQLAYAERLEDVESLIIGRFAPALTDDEKSTLKLCRQLRNKILHCDFLAARKKLRELGIDAPGSGVKKVDINGLSGPEMREKLARVIENTPGTFTRVTDSTAGAGTVFGWLMEVGDAGDLIRAAEAFARAAAIVDRLATD
jgi:hypothetical protein